MPFVRVCSRLTYTYLLRDGVAIHEYKQRALHGKVALIDGTGPPWAPAISTR